MFALDSPMTLTDVCFSVEVEDEETRRIVVCTFRISPFTPAHAEALNVRSLIFESSSGAPRPALDAVVANVHVDDQRLTFAMAPDQAERRIVIPNVRIDEKLRVKAKTDREPPSLDATLKLSFLYPSPDVLMYVANGVGDTHYLTFEPEQGDLLTAEDDGEPIRKGRNNGAAATTH